MSPFRLLGLPNDASETDIKRAYARKLRTTRPDDDPVAFQQLNDAYQAALFAP
jgi:curved DNA-binding protein CbpA